MKNGPTSTKEDSVDKNQVLVLMFMAVGVILLMILAYLSYKMIGRTLQLNQFKKALESNRPTILTQKVSFEKDTKEGESQHFMEKTHAFLLHAGMTFNPYLFLGAVGLLGVGFGALMLLLLKNFLALAVGVFVGIYLPIYIIGMISDARRIDFNQALSEAMSVVVRMMRNGVGFEQALRRSVDISSSKLFKQLMQTFLKEKDLLGDEQAFAAIFPYVKSEELRLFALAIDVGKSSGGKFSSTLEKLERSIRQRVQLQRKITVATREAKVGSYMIVGILVLIFVMLDHNFAGKITDYFFGSDSGRLYFMGIITWVGIGLFVNSRLTRIA